MDRYPPPRARELPPAAELDKRFPRFDSTGGLVALTDTDAEVTRFSPDVARVVVRATAFDALITVQRRGATMLRPVRVVAGTEWDAGAAAELILGRNAVAASVSNVQVIGYYVSDPPPAPGRAPEEYATSSS